MKSTGIVRKVDQLGRIVIPIEIREIFDIKIKDGLEIFTEDNTIILKKYEPYCVF
jgi:AbrB family transcriptional regulator, transcriptional pleiotropic regulator of transition state genes